MSIKWDQRFLFLAAQVATWSKDPSTQVGALLVSPDRRQIVPGYNGFPQAVDDNLLSGVTRELRLGLTVHAELNALLTAARDVSGWTCYVTHLPCTGCLAALVQARVARIVSRHDPAFATRWRTPAHDVLVQYITYEEL